jgi:hypothetical protein
MKKLFLLIIGFIFSLTMIAQGNKEHNKQEQKTKELNDHARKIWAGTSDKGGGGPKLSKNQPAKVSAAFQRDYPNAGNISWSKYRGDWAADFRNGSFISTAVYHANGVRKDTRMLVTRNDVPVNVLDSVFKRRPAIKLGDIIKIELPNVVNNIFRFNDIIQGKTTYFYYNWDGQLIKYDY